MILIICTSHLYIPASLSIIREAYSSVCIVTHRESIYKFFSKMYPENNNYLIHYRNANAGLLNTIIEIRQVKKKLKSFFENRKVDRLYFFHEGFCRESNWLILYLKKKQNSEVVYSPIERIFSPEIKWTEDYSIKNLKRKLYTFLYWNYWEHYYKYFNNVYPIMDQSFFRKIKSIEVKHEIVEVDILQEINDKLLKTNEYPSDSIVWLENTIRYRNIDWSEKSYNVFLENTLNALSNRIIFYKGHPDMVIKYGKEHEMRELPSFIPGNLLVHRFKCFIGVFSDLLFEVANAGTPAISILYLFKMDNDEREKLVGLLKKRNQSIYFPKSIAELRKTIDCIFN